MTDAISIRYTNWRGETADRNIKPVRIWFGTTEWHSEWQWLMEAFDLDKGDTRHFALADMVFKPATPDALAASPEVQALIAEAVKAERERCANECRLVADRFRSQMNGATLSDASYRLAEAEASEKCAIAIRALAPIDGLDEVAKLRAERDAIATARDMMGNLWAEAKAGLAAANAREAGLMDAVRMADAALEGTIKNMDGDDVFRFGPGYLTVRWLRSYLAALTQSQPAAEDGEK